MKLQWKSISEEQERRNSRLRDYRSLIGEKLDYCYYFVCFIYETVTEVSAY